MTPDYIDREHLLAALALYYQPGDVFEVRVLDATRRDYRVPHVESGWFSGDQGEAVAEALAGLTSWRGVYVTPNPVNPDLLARAANRLIASRRDMATNDADILARRWLLIDLDPVRPAGIAATDAEHDAALTLAQDIAAGMDSMGWPAPITVDSGNGAQLLYRVDLPTDDGGMIQRCLRSLAAAGNEAVKIDLAVHNAARIWRLPGTMNRKGDSLPHRPHRLARVLSAPEALAGAPLALVEALAGSSNAAPEPETRQKAVSAIPGDRAGDAYNQTADVPALLRSHGWTPNHDETRWTRPGKTDGSTSATWNGEHFYVFSSNAAPLEPNTAYRPFALLSALEHGGDFHAAAQALADGAPRPMLPEVDLSGILARYAPPADADDDEPSDAPGDPGPLPDDLLIVPGFLESMLAWTLSTAPQPNPVLSFAGALAMLSWLTGRKLRTPGGLRSNLYLLALAESGAGKDWPRQANARMLLELDATRGYATNVASGEALQDAVAQAPALLVQSDEIDTLIANMAGDDGSTGGRWLGLSGVLLEMFSAAGSLYALRRRAGHWERGKPRQDHVAPVIDQPHLVLFGTATPRALYAALSETLIARGLLSRMLVLEAGPRQDGQDSTDLADVPAPILRLARAWHEYRPGGGNMWELHPTPAVVPLSDEARTLIQSGRADADAAYREAEQRGDGIAMPIWSRAAATAERLALLYAASGWSPDLDSQPLVIQTPAARWGVAVAQHLARQLINRAALHCGDGPFAKAQAKALAALARGKGHCSERDMARALKAYPPRMQKEVLAALAAQGRVKEGNFPGRRRAAIKGWITP